jgi:hypothetical protein
VHGLRIQGTPGAGVIRVESRDHYQQGGQYARPHDQPWQVPTDAEMPVRHRRNTSQLVLYGLFGFLGSRPGPGRVSRELLIGTCPESQANSNPTNLGSRWATAADVSTFLIGAFLPNDRRSVVRTQLEIDRASGVTSQGNHRSLGNVPETGANLEVRLKSLVRARLGRTYFWGPFNPGSEVLDRQYSRSLLPRTTPFSILPTSPQCGVLGRGCARRRIHARRRSFRRLRRLHLGNLHYRFACRRDGELHRGAGHRDWFRDSRHSRWSALRLGSDVPAAGDQLPRESASGP